MQIHIQLIPISSPDQIPAGPDPPENIYHYTTGLKLRSIINSGAIKPTTAKIEPYEKPVAWFSTQDQWEPTCTKVPVPGMQGQIETAKAQGGLVRITVPGTCAPYVFPQLPLIAGVGEALLPVLTPEKSASTNPANEVAKKLTGRDYVSWSALSTFRTCPLKYRFRYIDGLPEESVSSALVFGSGIHSAIESHFQSLLSGDPKPDLDALLFAYRSAWLPHDPDAIQFGSTETRASLDALATRMLTAFLASPASIVQGRVLGVEEEIRGMLVEGVPDLFGRVDLLTEDSDSLVITDIKTSRGKWSQEQVEDSGDQLLMYSHLASEISPGKQLKTRFLIITKGKEPVIEEHVREVEPGNVKRTLAGVERVWRAIESGVFYPAPSVMSCASCGYRAACRAWMG